MPDLASAASRVTAVVVVWNSGQPAVELLRGLDAAFAAGMRAVFVDNASADGSFGVLREFLDGWEQGSRVELVQSGDNIGFTAGVNLATDRALAAPGPPEFIWMLNPDARAAPEAVRMLVAVADASGAPVVTVGARVYVRPGRWPRPFFARAESILAPVLGGMWWPAGNYNGASSLFSSALIRRLIAETGEFQDASLFMDFDEWECSVRLHELGGWIAFANGVPVVHEGTHRTDGPGPIPALRQYYQSRNPILVCRKALPAWQFWPLLAVRLARDLSWFARLRLRGRQPNERAYLAGVWDGLRGRTGRWKHHPHRPPVSH